LFAGRDCFARGTGIHCDCPRSSGKHATIIQPTSTNRHGPIIGVINIQRAGFHGE
jgi:hypothetical protein